MIDLVNSDFETSEVDQCSYGILNNDTFVPVEQYVFEFVTGSTPYCGAESTIYFIFCAEGGGTSEEDQCSEIYEIAGQLPETGEIVIATVTKIRFWS